MTAFKWRSVIDSQLGVAFGVSPWTGALLAEEVSTTASWRPPRLLGFDPKKCGALQDFARADEILDPDPQDDDLSEDIRRLAQQRARTFYRLAFAIPIVWVIAMATIDSRRRAAGEEWIRIADSGRAAAVSAALFGRRSHDDCLPLSIARYWFLRSVGQRAFLHVGVFVPTDTLHAWVQLGAVPILESADELVHYQSCLVFGH